ncbi:HAD-IIIA family hydrolase [Cellulomonas fengjieae]|uniref:D,D-heptose 1,7-bisphosphate phosphatase n=1 Tax=Cellulomonas fengjieae TaxID=2819978 RepID=A0ABS3SJ42_9CELL|nr:HAD-IIIA family hydrolase [Cellulomonas fengjieae]MBO3085768.1 HAD-IIIA family hydrolase [Cellulomonas fengjieae]MBO3102878.1 HAD-IIIA family hydrolase [Cellulomonas fengjieae]QVI67525.1 HAD-IIIA family hydrolase [Cellulomonas fengjieae]
MNPGPSWSVVVPTVGRPSLDALLAGLVGQDWSAAEPGPSSVVVCDDRPLSSTVPLVLPDLPWPSRVVRTGGRGPAAARNAGWRTTADPWVAFLDDDVLLPPGWARAFLDDLRAAGPDVAGTQARLRVPLPTDRRPTDWERSTAGLEHALWATADMAFRRSALRAVQGFDERFPRAYREDADLALRLRQAGWRLEHGSRTTHHPVRPADDRVSVRVQAGAADDALMRALHGRRWRELAGTGRGRFPWHVVTVGTAVAAVGAASLGRRGPATAAAAAWLLLTGDFARRRIGPGPRLGEPDGAAEWRRMAWTSAVIPFAAVRHRITGTIAHRQAMPWRPVARAVLFDRDGTLIHDVPYNGDPARVDPVPGADETLGALRGSSVAVGLVTNQSGVARGLLSRAQVDAVNGRVAELLGPFDTVQVCPHGPASACPCRKPAAGMVLRAAHELGLAPWECAVVGDIGADIDAARAAGARAVLVPTAATRPEEVRSAELVAADLREAVSMLVPDLERPR